MESRQVRRARERSNAKIAAFHDRVAARREVRKAKKMPPLSWSEMKGYPGATYDLFEPRGKSYAGAPGLQESARRLKQMEVRS